MTFQRYTYVQQQYYLAFYSGELDGSLINGYEEIKLRVKLTRGGQMKEVLRQLSESLDPSITNLVITGLTFLREQEDKVEVEYRAPVQGLT